MRLIKTGKPRKKTKRGKLKQAITFPRIRMKYDTDANCRWPRTGSLVNEDGNPRLEEIFLWQMRKGKPK